MIAVIPQGGSWAVKHNGGYLGYAHNRDETLGIANDLIAWLDWRGRSAELVVGELLRLSGGMQGPSAAVDPE